jgi:hypothetical protein
MSLRSKPPEHFSLDYFIVRLLLAVRLARADPLIYQSCFMSLRSKPPEHFSLDYFIVRLLLAVRLARAS